MIELTEVISELRRELQEAMSVGEFQALRFDLGPVELEATVVVEKSAGGSGKVRFWVIEPGGDAKVSQASVQRIKLALQPRTTTGSLPMVAGDAYDRER